MFGGRAEVKGRGSVESWVLLVKEELPDKVVEVYLTDMYPKRSERGARVISGLFKVLVSSMNTT